MAKKQTSKTKTGKRGKKATAIIDKAPASDRRRAMRIYNRLLDRYPDAHCALNHSNPFELLCATILSAQCTDVLVNKVTPGLFNAYPNPQALAAASVADIEKRINRVNFYRNKAKSLQGMAQMLVEEYDSTVPQSMEQLLKLPGVARKTANVVLGNAFNINLGVVVDTHIARLSQRFGFTKHTDPKKIEQDLMALFPRDKWTLLAHLLIYHGRQVCKARHGLCKDDPICRAYCSDAKT